MNWKSKQEEKRRLLSLYNNISHGYPSTCYCKNGRLIRNYANGEYSKSLRKLYNKKFRLDKEIVGKSTIYRKIFGNAQYNSW